MSKAAVLIGIPVREAPPRQKERPRPVRRKPPGPRRRWPWLLMAVSACSALWALGIISVARRADVGSAAPPQAAPPVVLAAAPVVQTPAEPARPEIVPVDEVVPKPAPELPVRPLPAIPDEPPPLRILPEESQTPIACKPEPLPTPAAPTMLAAEPRRPQKDIDLKVYANCSTIGTDVLFVKDPTEAFRRAKAEKKLVYMMHLSGNLEDKEFT